MMSLEGQINPHPPLKLLLAEDEFMVAWSMIVMARSLGHEVCASVRTEREVTEAVTRLKPDVIVLDYRLAEGGDGLKVAHLLREAGHIPIIFCTAYGESLRPALHALSGVHLIIKPVSVNSLRKALAWAAGWPPNAISPVQVGSTI